MNKIYKLIWNEATQAWVLVSELVSSRGKKSVATSLALLGVATICGQVHAETIAWQLNPGQALPPFSKLYIRTPFDAVQMTGINFGSNSHLQLRDSTIDVIQKNTPSNTSNGAAYGIRMHLVPVSNKSSLELDDVLVNVYAKDKKKAYGIYDYNSNFIDISNTTFNVYSEAGAAYGFYGSNYLDCSGANTDCSNRLTQVSGKTVMNVSNGNTDERAVGWILNTDPKNAPQGLQFQNANSITHIKTGGKSIPFGYYIGRDTQMSFDDSTLSGTANGVAGVKIMANGKLYFKGTTHATSPLHILMGAGGEVYINDIDGTVFSVDELRALSTTKTGTGYDYGEISNESSSFTSDVYLGDKTLLLTGKHNTANAYNQLYSVLHGSAKSKFIKQGSNVLTINSDHQDFLGEVVVEGGVLEINGYDDGHFNKIKQLTVKNGATVSGYDTLYVGSGSQSTKFTNEPNIGNNPLRI